MTGRGIDQILRYPCAPRLHEDYANSALQYVGLAEQKNGPIPRHVEPAYVWGAALEEFDRAKPQLRIVNLETSITRSDDYVPKGINYRMSPENADCLQAAGIDCCVLANNHVLDWGDKGLLETISTLERLRIAYAGAGRNIAEASAPAIFDVNGTARILVIAAASATSGTPAAWAARAEQAGVHLLKDLSDAAADRIAESIQTVRQPGDIVVVSLHWGPNWGYDVTSEECRFAHALIDIAHASIVYGHSSHHPKGIELFQNRLILYGCGDFLNDYEGIHGYEEFRGDLSLMYFADVDAVSGTLISLEMMPLQMRRFRLVHPSDADIVWLQQTLDRQCRRVGSSVIRGDRENLWLSYDSRCGPFS